MLFIVSNYPIESLSSIPREVEDECVYIHEDKMESLQEAVLFAHSVINHIFKNETKYKIKIYEVSNYDYKCVWEWKS